MKSHTRATITLEGRAIMSNSTKQKVNARSSSKSKMVTADNTLSKVLWTKQFIEAQSHQAKAIIVYKK
jgi:hypothetical protein